MLIQSKSTIGDIVGALYIYKKKGICLGVKRLLYEWDVCV
jgi:hypothetical protein